MPLFVSTKPVSLTIDNIEITLECLTELSVGEAIAAQKREAIAAQKREDGDDFFEGGISLLLTYIKGWSLPEPLTEETLRRLTLPAFEALVVAVSDAIAPAEDPDQDPEAPSPN